MKTSRLLFIILVAFSATHSLAEPPPDPAKIEDSVRIIIGKKLMIQFQADGNILKKPVVTEHPDTKEPVVSLDFSQQDGSVMLDIKNNFPKALHCQCLARLKGKTTYFETDIVTIMAGLDDFESWEDPIEELVLFDFKLTDEKVK
jgi:hypothetical protein